MSSIDNKINKHEYFLSDNPKITIGFDNGTVYGSGGVNRYTGTYSIKNGKISFSNLGLTMMMGNQQDMDKESKFISSLNDNLSINIDKENKLIIGSYIFTLISK